MHILLRLEISFAWTACSLKENRETKQIRGTPIHT